MTPHRHDAVLEALRPSRSRMATVLPGSLALQQPAEPASSVDLVSSERGARCVKGISSRRRSRKIPATVVMRSVNRAPEAMNVAWFLLSTGRDRNQPAQVSEWADVRRQ